MPAVGRVFAVTLSAAALLAMAAAGWSGQPMIPAGGPLPPTEGPMPVVPVAPVTATAPAAPVPTDPFIRNLLAQLNSPDPAQRDAAQKELISIAGLMQQPEILKHLQDVSTDQDLKDFFGTRITQLRANEEEKRLTNLPPITLKLSNATIFQVVSELNKSLGNSTAFMAENNGSPNGRTFTIDAKEQPFWEVFTALQEQQNIEIQNYGDNQPPRLTLNGNVKSPYSAIHGPAMATLTSASYDRSVNFQTPPGSRQNPSLNINFNIAIDPRIHASRVKSPTNVKMTDDEGRTLQTPNNGGGYNGGNSMVFGLNLNVTPPDRLGKSISFSFDSAISTTVGDTKVSIDDIAQNINKPMTIGSRILRIANFNQDNPNNINMTLDVQPADRAAGFNNDVRTPFSITDASGREVYRSAISFGGMGFGFSTNNAKPPYKLEISVPGRSFEIPLHFEFKEVPLP